MATFTINGYDIRSTSNMVTQADVAQLRYVSPLGTAALDYRYVLNESNSAEVSLNDYNLILNGTHLNDMPLPDRIEIFTLSWTAQGVPQTAEVLNMAFGDANTESWRDCLFAVDGPHLPDLTNSQTIEAFFKAAVMTVPGRDSKENEFTIQLENMPGVEVTGAIARFFAEQDSGQAEQDRFEFATQTDIGQEIFLHDYVALQEGPPELAATATIDPPSDDAVDPLGAFLPETGYDDFAS